MEVALLEIQSDSTSGIALLKVAPAENTAIISGMERWEWNRNKYFWITPLQFQQLGLRIVAWDSTYHPTPDS